MISKNDITIVLSVLNMTEEQRESFIKKLSSGEQGYLRTIIDQYEKSLG